MKAISFIFLLFIAQSPTLKPGEYRAAKPFNFPYDKEQSLMLHSDGTFSRIYYASEMHFEKRRHKITGAWKQNVDTLTLTDTMLFDGFVKQGLKKVYGTEDTAIIRTIKYTVQKDGRLHYISAIAGQKPTLRTPDFIFNE